MITKLTEMSSPVGPIRTELLYLPHDPFAVHIEFSEADGSVTLWNIGRESLRLGLSSYRPMGDGDIACAMCWHNGREMFHILLKPPEGMAHLCGEIADFRDFLYETYLLVPAGQENQHVDYDREIRRLLG